MGMIVVEYSGHQQITEAGWVYRMNDRRGWVIYKDPQSGKWHTHSEAIFIVQARVPNRSGPRLVDAVS